MLDHHKMNLTILFFKGYNRTNDTIGRLIYENNAKLNQSCIHPCHPWRCCKNDAKSSTDTKSGKQNKQTIQTTKKVAEFQKTLDEEETKKRNETFNKIYNESLVRTKFENWQKVDELHGLGQRTGQFLYL